MTDLPLCPASARSTLEARLIEAARERRARDAGIAIAALWHVEAGRPNLARALLDEMGLTRDDLIKADDVERITWAGYGLDDLLDLFAADLGRTAP